MATTDYGFTSTAGADSPYTTTLKLSTTAEGLLTRVESVVAAGTNTTCWLTANSIPNNAAWADSRTQTVKLDISVGDMNMRARCKVGRTDGTNTILQEGAFTAYQTLT